MAQDRLQKKIGKGRHLSALKRERQNDKRRERNRPARSKLRNAIKAVRENPNEELLKKTIPIISKAASKHLIPKQRAARITSRLTKFVASAKSV